MSGAKLSGKCLCGAISVTADITEKDTVGACHCSMCRKWSGGTFLAVHVGDRASFEGEENIGVFSKINSEIEKLKNIGEMNITFIEEHDLEMRKIKSSEIEENKIEIIEDNKIETTDIQLWKSKEE